MKFEEAIKLLKEGKKVRRVAWGNTYVSCVDGDVVYSNGNEFVTSMTNLGGTDWKECKEEGERNPAHFCFNCDKFLGHRGFCSKKCHDEWYDEVYPSDEDDWNFSNNIKNTDSIPFDIVNHNVMELKTKILEDIDKLKYAMDTGLISEELVKEIISKRFGF